MSEEEIVQRILSHQDSMTRKEIAKAIEEKKAASGGFLTSEAAARLVAVELGVKVELEELLPKAYISQLVAGLNDATVSGRVLLVTTPQQFSRPRGNGQVARLLIADKTGSIGVVLWDDKAEFTRKIHLRQIVKALHGYVRRSRDGEIELHIGQRGDVRIIPSDMEESDFPRIEELCEKIGNIDERHRRVNIQGLIKAVYSTSTFQRRNGTQGKVMRIIVEDESGRIPVVFWNEKADDMANAKEGVEVLVMNAKVKKNRRDRRLELHVDYFANVEVQKPCESFLRIKDLKKGMRINLVEGKVATKPVLKEVTTRRGEKVVVASFKLADDTGEALVSAWRKHASKVEGLDVGAKVKLREVFVLKASGDQLEIATRTSSIIETE